LSIFHFAEAWRHNSATYMFKYFNLGLHYIEMYYVTAHDATFGWSEMWLF